MPGRARITARSGDPEMCGLGRSLSRIDLRDNRFPAAYSAGGTLALRWAALAALAFFAGSAARADDLPPKPAAAPGQVPDLDATYDYRENADGFRVRIHGAAITRDQGGDDGVEHRFIDNAAPKWQASVSIRTQHQKPAGKDSISWGVSKLRHLVVPPGAEHAGDKAMGDEDPGRIRAFDAGLGDIDSAIAYQSEFRDHSDGKNRHADRYTVLYTQDANPDGKDIDSWRLTIRGQHTERPASKFGKQKNISIDESVAKTLTVDLRIVMAFTPDTATQANGFVGSAIEGNTFGPGLPGMQNVVLHGGVADNSGMTLIQQAAGIGYNQGIGISIAEVTVGDRPFADSQMDMEQTSVSNTLLGAASEGNGVGNDVVVATNAADAAVSMNRAVRRNVGVTVVQQSAGVANNQHVGMALAVGIGPGGVALSDADMSQTLVGNRVQNFSGAKSATLTDAVAGNSGITVVQQSAGSLGNQGVTVAIAGANGPRLR